MAVNSIFICHARPDAAFAQDLSLTLEICRLSVWRDSRNLRGSDPLAPEVRWAIEQARQVIVVIGLHTGYPAWMRREIELAQETERRRRGSQYQVIPLLLPETDDTLLKQWFVTPPRHQPIRLPAQGLGTALPELLHALGEILPSELAGERNPTPAAELELTFLAGDPAVPDSWQWTARLHHGVEPASPSADPIAKGSLPLPFPEQLLHWYLHSHPCWPTDTLRSFARRTEALLATWGHSLYQATLENPQIQAVTAAWRAIPEPGEYCVAVRVATPSPTTLTVLNLPWELLRESTGFLIQNKRPVQFFRRLEGGGGTFAPLPPPLRVLVLSPRPDTEVIGYCDYRRSALPFLEALDGLGKLIEPHLLVPPTFTMLEKQLDDARLKGRPFSVLHLDACLHQDPDSNTLFIGFEAPPELYGPKYRKAHLVEATTLATLLAAYQLRLIVLYAASGTEVGAATTVRFVSILLQAGLSAAITVRTDTPHETQRRFWSTFYEELLRGAKVGQALAVSQRRLAGDSYRAPGLDGGDVSLQDWFCPALYLGASDSPLCLRPPLELWRRLEQPPPPPPLPLTSQLPAAGFIGRSRELRILERLLADRTAVFLRGPSGEGKTAIAAALAVWLARCNRFCSLAYVSSDDASDPHKLLETLGRQLLPQDNRWSVDRYPNLWRALDHLRQHLRDSPTLIVLDQLEHWPEEHEAAFDLFWKDFLNDWPDLRLLGLGRLGPPPFARPWVEATLGPMEDQDAITLTGKMLIANQDLASPSDTGTGFSQLRALVGLVASYPIALQRLAREINLYGVNASLATLRSPLRSELLRLHGNDRQWPFFLNLELALRHLLPKDRERLAILAFFKNGANRIALSKGLLLDTRETDTFCAQLLNLNLAKDRGYGHLRFDASLSHYLNSQLTSEQRQIWRERWRVGMEQLLEILYQQYFKDKTRVTRLLRLELSNFLTLLRDSQQRGDSAQAAHLASRLEPMLANLGASTALTEVVAARERAGHALSGWNRLRFDTERLRIERLRDDGSLEAAIQAAGNLLEKCQTAGEDAYAGARYDLARTHFQLGKLLKLSGAADPAVQALNEARQHFQALAEAGNHSAERMVAVANAEIGDCLSYLQRLQEAATAYEDAIARSGPTTADLALAANKMQLGMVRQRQGHYVEAITAYDGARELFELLGEAEGTARAWRQIAIARKLNEEMPAALQACQQALYLYEQRHNRAEVAEILGELGHLHLALQQLEAAALAYRRMADLCAELGDGHGEESARNHLANVLIQLRRHDEARQELYRASECNLPESHTARNWAIRRGLHDIGQAVQNPQVADQARQQAMRKYLAYRRAGGQNTNPGARLCEQTGRAIRADSTAELSAMLKKMAASPNIPAAGQNLIAKLQAILGGSRDSALTDDPNLHYQYAVELQLLLEDLIRSERTPPKCNRKM